MICRTNSMLKKKKKASACSLSRIFGEFVPFYSAILKNLIEVKGQKMFFFASQMLDYSFIQGALFYAFLTC